MMRKVKDIPYFPFCEGYAFYVDGNHGRELRQFAGPKIMRSKRQRKHMVLAEPPVGERLAAVLGCQ